LPFETNFYICNYRANNKLTVTLPYKHFIAAFLLGLYTFIATPVQLWHHHKNGCGNQSIASKQAVVTTLDDALSDANCAVCSHKYSTYNDEALTPFVSSFILLPAIYNLYCPDVLPAPVFTLSNKGPPALA
jgi:hypothetical protein